jgi:hypothetical protein
MFAQRLSQININNINHQIFQINPSYQTAAARVRSRAPVYRGSRTIALHGALCPAEAGGDFSENLHLRAGMMI